MSKKILINSLIGLSLLTTANSFAWNICVLDELSHYYDPDLYAKVSDWGSYDTIQRNGNSYCTNISSGNVSIIENNPNGNRNCSFYSIPYDHSMSYGKKHPWIEVHDNVAVCFTYDSNGNLHSKNYNPDEIACFNGFYQRKLA